MSEKKVTGWITVKGNHIPLFDGESNDTAYKRFISKEKVKEVKQYLEDNPGKGLPDAVEHYKYEHPDENEDLKEKQIAANKAQADQLNGKSAPKFEGYKDDKDIQDNLSTFVEEYMHPQNATPEEQKQAKVYIDSLLKEAKSEFDANDLLEFVQKGTLAGVKYVMPIGDDELDISGYENLDKFRFNKGKLEFRLDDSDDWYDESYIMPWDDVKYELDSKKRGQYPAPHRKTSGIGRKPLY